MKEKFMRMAIEEAKKSSDGLRCGATIVKDNEVISCVHNTVKITPDATAHAEINAIREASQKLDKKKLKGYEIYCTCEPCVMCLSAICFARIGKIYYGLNLRDVSPLNKIIDVKIDNFLESCNHDIEVEKNFMEEECKVLVE